MIENKIDLVFGSFDTYGTSPEEMHRASAVPNHSCVLLHSTRHQKLATAIPLGLTRLTTIGGAWMFLQSGLPGHRRSAVYPMLSLVLDLVVTNFTYAEGERFSATH